MTRLDRQPAQTRHIQTQRDPVPPREAWSGNGPPEDQDLMAEREVLERGGGSTGEEATQEGPETDPQNHPKPSRCRSPPSISVRIPQPRYS